MNLAAIWNQWRKGDWLTALVTVVIFTFFAGAEPFQFLERKAYDLSMRFSERAPSDKIAVIAIDQTSIDNLGRWPWSREVHAKMHQILASAGAKVVANATIFAEKQGDFNSNQIGQALELLLNTPLDRISDTQIRNNIQAARNVLQAASKKADGDNQLAQVLGTTQNSILGYTYDEDPTGDSLKIPAPSLPPYFLASKLTSPKLSAEDEVTQTAIGKEPSIPLPLLGEKAQGIGFLNLGLDQDGVTRRQPLTVNLYQQYYPALALVTIARFFNVANNQISLDWGEGIRLDQLRIPTDPRLQLLPRFYPSRGGKSPIPVDSFSDVYLGKIPAAKYQNKIVLIGPAVPGVSNVVVNPLGEGVYPILVVAQAISSILQQDYFAIPHWGPTFSWLVYLLVALYLILLLPRIPAKYAASITGAMILLLIATYLSFLQGKGWWIELITPSLLLLVGYLVLATKRFLFSEAAHKSAAAASAASDRLLGLTFQQQGQLDMAWDKFRQVPIDNSMLEPLYNLGLDFERKRQFNKAANVFQYIADFNATYRDTKQRLDRSKQMENTIIFGGSNQRSNSLFSDGIEKPMLGRYVIEKELGKGSMGVVYLGKDPKISRVVAIKTLELSNEFDPAELSEVKERFFREAETAGRLNHPNIVTIYDAGEEQDLAYIAMEFLKGRNLVPYTKLDQLLPLAKVMDMIARIADALAFAHSHNVVHRDIKPANIMYEPESDQLKVTDFGVARITDASKTKTGVILGTPSYMSPEQLAGKRIDGRSDLFSLGVMLYQMACGRLPFQGDSLTELMYKIANEPTPDIRTINPDIPSCLVDTIYRSLAKNPDERYQEGSAMAKDLRDCLQNWLELTNAP